MLMNFLSKLWLFACVAVFAGILLPGCSSPETPIFTDNPNAPITTSSPANGSSSTNDATSLNDANAAIFGPGETVTVASTTGSDSPGPVATAGQPYVIGDDGTITLPFIGPVQAANKTPDELQNEIQKLYVPQYYVRLTITVSGQSRVYYLGGEINHPGPQVYMGKTTVTTAIQAAGDFTQFASHKVWLTRTDGTRIKVNVDKALRDSTQDPPVFPGDKIEVYRRIF